MRPKCDDIGGAAQSVLDRASTVLPSALKALHVIPAGELWPDGGLRPAIEDLLGAGAIIHHLDLPCSPEAQVVRDATDQPKTRSMP